MAIDNAANPRTIMNCGLDDVGAGCWGDQFEEDPPNWDWPDVSDMEEMLGPWGMEEQTSIPPDGGKDGCGRSAEGSAAASTPASVRPIVAPPIRGPAEVAQQDRSFCLTVETVNGSCWAAARRRIEAAGEGVHAFVVQETRLAPSAADEASRWLASRGWASVWSHGLPGARGGRSAGVAVVARLTLGLAGPEHGVEEVVKGRVVSAMLSLPDAREIASYSVWVQRGER